MKAFDFGGYNSRSVQPSLNRNFIHPITVVIPLTTEQRAIGRILGALDDLSRLRPSVLYAWMLTSDFLEQVNQVSHQTDLAPYVSLRDQRNMTMPLFGPDRHSVADILDPLLDRASLNFDQSKTLARLRDALLAKLISGELRVRDAEHVVAEAAAEEASSALGE